jgi:hypothetical protein
MLYCYKPSAILKPTLGHLLSDFNTAQFFATPFYNLEERGSIFFLKKSRGRVAKISEIFCSSSSSFPLSFSIYLFGPTR